MKATKQQLKLPWQVHEANQPGNVTISDQMRIQLCWYYSPLSERCITAFSCLERRAFSPVNAGIAASAHLAGGTEMVPRAFQEDTENQTHHRNHVLMMKCSLAEKLDPFPEEVVGLVSTCSTTDSCSLILPKHP